MIIVKIDICCCYSAELQRRRELGIVFRKRDKGSGQHIEDKEEKLKYSILIKSKFRNDIIK